MRGIGPGAFALRPEMKLVEGRLFQAGLNEMIVGRAAQRQVNGAQAGGHIPMQNGDWTITGVFESNADAHESEFVTDANTLIAAMRRGATFNSATVWLENGAAFTTFKDAASANPALSVDVKSEPAYYEEASKPVARILNIVAYVIGGFILVGIVFALAIGTLGGLFPAIRAARLPVAVALRG